MGSLLRLLMLLLLAAAPCAFAAELRPGEQVCFVERDQHIPAHPAPGDSHVHLRLVSGPEVTVLQVKAATGWIELRGEPLQGSENTGWITLRYLAGRADGGNSPLTPSRGVPRVTVHVVGTRNTCQLRPMSRNIAVHPLRLGAAIKFFPYNDNRANEVIAHVLCYRSK
jgi:hypothetical protein